VYVASTGESKTPPEGSTYSVTFSADGQATIVADCNTVMASYTSGDDGAFSIDLGASTLVACPEGSIAEDFLAVLAAATSARVVEAGGQIAVSISAADGSLVVLTGTR
jgi:heat shock protein HslJ